MHSCAITFEKTILLPKSVSFLIYFHWMTFNSIYCNFEMEKSLQWLLIVTVIVLSGNVWYSCSQTTARNIRRNRNSDIYRGHYNWRNKHRDMCQACRFVNMQFLLNILIHLIVPEIIETVVIGDILLLKITSISVVVLFRTY